MQTGQILVFNVGCCNLLKKNVIDKYRADLYGICMFDGQIGVTGFGERNRVFGEFSKQGDFLYHGKGIFISGISQGAHLNRDSAGSHKSQCSAF